ncbi:MAG TPA: 2-dehydro-3-deoxygalactonokinase [Acetobacteraceae bacterium]
MIGVDWGNTGFNAFRLSGDAIRERRASSRGIQSVQDGRFGDTLREEIGPWLAGGERHVLLSGAIGTRGGWMAPDLPCPAGPTEIAAGLVDVAFDWAEVKVVPALSCAASGAAEVTRAATLILGALAQIGGHGLACVPGAHAIWARIEAGRIAGFATHLTGEAFAAWRAIALPGRAPRDGPASDRDAFDAGLDRSARPGGLLHHLSAVRALALSGQLADAAGASFLWGIMVGHEVRAALAEMAGSPMVYVIGAPELTAPYARAIEAAGGMAERLNGDAVARGLALIGAAARWG